MGIRRSVPLVILTAVLSLAQARAVVPQIALTPLAEEDSAPAGRTVRLALRVQVPPGIHLQSDQPRDPSLVAARLSFAAPRGLSVVDLAFPSSADFRVLGFDEPLAVFEGDFAVGIRIAVARDATPGTVTFPARFRYQACNDTTCFAPKMVDTQWQIPLTASATATRTAHRDVFSRIAWDRARAPIPADVTAAPVAAAPVEGDPGGPLSNEQLFARFDRFTILGTGEYMAAADFVTFIKNAEAGITPTGLFEGRGPLAILAIVFIGGLALNLTPCVLPMIPINLAIIGAGSGRASRGRGFLLGLAYGTAITLVYGAIGLVVILTAGTFGTINASPWFNLGIAMLFGFLGLAMFDVVSLDFSRYSSRVRFDDKSRGTFLLAFGMGAVAAFLAGACVAPVVVQVVIFASDLYANGTAVALALPFVLGLGMALPWPLAGAGIASLPRPGAWMVRVKQVMGVFILATAAYYGYVAYEILSSRWVDPASVKASVEAQLKEGWHASLAEGLETAERTGTAVLVDFWASWCKNCLVMDRTTLRDPAVVSALAGYTRIKFQAEDPNESPARELMQRVGAVGLPAYVILRPKNAPSVSAP